MRVRVTGPHPFPYPHVDGEATYAPRVGHPFTIITDKIVIEIAEVAKVGSDGTFETVNGTRYGIRLLDVDQVADLRRRGRRRGRS